MDTDADPTLGAEQHEALEHAIRILLEKLSPARRAVYVLREAFDYPYRQIAEALALSEVNARQVVTRARRRLAGDSCRMVGVAERQQLLAAFVAAAQTGEIAHLERLLAADVAGCSGVLQTAAREQLTPDGRRQLAGILGCPPEQLDGELDGLVARARASRATLVVDAALRQRARAGGYAYVHERGRDFAAGVWIVDPVFLIDALREPLTDATPVAADPGYFAGARLRDEDLRAAAGHDAQQRAAQRQRRQRAAESNLGLGHDLRAGLIDPTPEQLAAVKAIVCHLLARHGGELIAAGAGWSQREHQHPVGERGRHEPRQPDTILAAELEPALSEPDPLRAITALAATWAAAFVLDPDGLPRGGALGSERIARRVAGALPAEHPLRDAVWALLRPLLSPRLAELHRDAFATEADTVSTVDLDRRRHESDLDALDLCEDIAA